MQLNLNKNEMLVLFAFVSKINEGPIKPMKDLFVDQAEQRLCWDIEAMLEPILQVELGHEYKELLAKAREQVRDK